MAVRINPLITNKTQEIPGKHLRPHYSDERFGRDRIGALTVFLAEGARPIDVGTWEEVPGLLYIHSSTLAHRDDHVTAWRAAREEAGSDQNVVFFEGYAARLLGQKTIDIQHILSTVDIAGTGNPHQYFGDYPFEASNP